MQIGIKQLMEGKATRIKDRNYLATEDYVAPFFDRMAQLTEDFIVNVKSPDQVSTEDRKDDTIYNRVWIQAVLPGVAEGHSEVIGMVYGLDVKTPVMKFYKGGLNQACLNLCVMNPAALNVQPLDPDSAVDYSALDRVMDGDTGWMKGLDRMRATEVPYDNLDERLGMWVRNTLHCSYNASYGKVKLSVNNAVDAYKLLYETTTSPYYTTGATTLYNVYQAWTQTITDDTRDIVNKTEKTLLLTSILGLR